jgi:hypothetical protein
MKDKKQCQSAETSEQLAMNSEQSAETRKQSAVKSKQSAVTNKQSAVNSEQSAVNSEQSAVTNEQSAVNSEQSAVTNEKKNAEKGAARRSTKSGKVAQGNMIIYWPPSRNFHLIKPRRHHYG